jgi:LacI family transcriptional regulator
VPITLKELAEKTGLSRQAVGFILRGEGHFKDETRERVLKIATDLGYRPNAAARAMSSGRFNGIGLILSTHGWKSNLPSVLLEGIRDALMERDLHLSLSWFHDEKLAEEGQMPKILRELTADGLLIKYDSSVPAPIVEALTRSGVPAVWVNSKRRHDAVYPDDFQGARDATARLIAAGCRRIAYADYNPRPPEDHYSSTDRQGGYRKALEEAGSKVRVVSSAKPIPFEQRPAHIREWLRESPQPDAVVCYSEIEALAILHEALRRGLKVPDDLRIAAFGESVASVSAPELEAILLPNAEVGHRAVEMLLSKIRKPRAKQPAVAVAYASAL